MEKIIKSLLAILLFSQMNNLFAMDTKATKKTEQDLNLEEQFPKIEINMKAKDAYYMGLDFWELNELEIAFDYFEYAANKNHFYSQIQLTYMLMDGAGCEKNLVAALELCNLVRKISYEKSERAHKLKDDITEISYRKIYNEFESLWKDLVTQILTSETEISKLALLPLIEQGAMQVMGEGQDGENEDDKISDEFRDKIYC